MGKGVQQAVDNINTLIAPVLKVRNLLVLVQVDLMAA